MGYLDKEPGCRGSNSQTKNCLNQMEQMGYISGDTYTRSKLNLSIVGILLALLLKIVLR